MKVTASGFKELDALLQKLPGQVAREHLTDAVRGGAGFIAEEARRRAPRDTGDLAASIAIRMTRQRNTGGDPRAEIGPSKQQQHVGMFQELGTARHPAQPFLRPALDASGQTAVDVAGSVLRERLARLRAP